MRARVIPSDRSVMQRTRKDDGAQRFWSTAFTIARVNSRLSAWSRACRYNEDL
jgi:hypothetical protein